MKTAVAAPEPPDDPHCYLSLAETCKELGLQAHRSHIRLVRFRCVLAAYALYSAIILTAPVLTFAGLPWFGAYPLSLVMQLIAAGGVHFFSEGRRTGRNEFRGFGLAGMAAYAAFIAWVVARRGAGRVSQGDDLLQAWSLALMLGVIELLTLPAGFVEAVYFGLREEAMGHWRFFTNLLENAGHGGRGALRVCQDAVRHLEGDLLHLRGEGRDGADVRAEIERLGLRLRRLRQTLGASTSDVRPSDTVSPDLQPVNREPHDTRPRRPRPRPAPSPSPILRFRRRPRRPSKRPRL